MLAYPNCKINLGLNVVARRTDGYHDLETVFYPIAIHDALEIIQSNTLSFTATGLAIPGDPAGNLCLRAYHLLKQDFPSLPAVAIHLHKQIPMGAGLGGGSSNGAAMLQLLNRKFHLGLTEEQLIHYALQLGSDCPFFIINKPCFATGRGEQMTPVHLTLSDYSILIVNPGIHVSTREAFAGLTPTEPATSIQQIIKLPVADWKDQLLNDFEKTIFNIHPQIKKLKEDFYASGALYASMTGTGSTVLGIFEKGASMNIGNFNGYYYQWV